MGKPSLVWHRDTATYFGLHWKEETEGLIDQVCLALGFPNLRYAITVHWSAVRQVKWMGCAEFDTFRVWLSIPWFAHLSPWYRRQIIIHEACHLVAWLSFGDDGHGDGWIRCMKAVGGVSVTEMKVPSWPFPADSVMG